MHPLDETRNFFQGASNSVASGVSAPVDGIAWLLRTAGLPVNNPVGGSDWLRERGLTADAPGVAGLLGETAGGLLGPLASAKAPQIARGLLAGADNLAAPKTLGKQAGMALFDTNGLANKGRDLIQSNADALAQKLRVAGFKVDVQHSGSAAGPSSYLKVFDPQTGRFFDDVRLSGHSKGAYNSQSIKNVATPDELQGVIDRALGMRDLGPAVGFVPQQMASNLDMGAAKARPLVFNAFKEARDSGADFSKYKAK